MDFANIRSEKYVLALRCLVAAAGLDRDHPRLHEQIIRFKVAIDEDRESLASKSAEVIKSEFTLLPASVDLSKYNDEYLSKHKNSSRHVLSTLKVRKLLATGTVSSVEKDVVALLNLPDITLEEAIEALEQLTLWRSSEVGGFKTTAGAKWPNASAFAAAS